MHPCPSQDQLRQLLAEELPPADCGDVETHIQQCPHCQATLERLTEDPSVRPDHSLTSAHGQPDHAYPSGPNTFATLVGRTPPADVVGNVASAGSRYRILRPHARGGLGEVFVARDEELGREVALKEIQDHHALDPDSRMRFVLEAEVTGRLEHPGVVPVYGLGQHVDGRPFYAMRFIRGQTLNEAIDAYHSSAGATAGSAGRRTQYRDLLGRFIAVCNVIQYAHDLGVLHRDLKPSNIMLGKYGETLVVDWGLAKIVARAEAAATARSLPGQDAGCGFQTLPGLAFGTPGFLSPEQAAGKPDAVGPASDIYSLGAMLYCVITGKRPLQVADDVPQSVTEVLSKTQTGDFLRPRQVNSHIDPALEAIVVRAMALRPEARYGSARQLADDVERWLADEPVSAWTEPWRVRARRWVGRRRTLVTGAAAALLVGLVSMILATVLLTRANRDLESARNQAQDATRLAETRREEADTARKEAVEEAAAAVQVSNFMAGLIEQADPFVLGGHFLGDQPVTNPTALDVVERGARRLADPRFLAEKPLVRATLLDRVGHVYLSLGKGAKAEPFILEALELRQRHGRGDADELAASLHNVAFLHLTKGNLKQSADLFAQAIAMRTRLFGTDGAATVTSRFHHALALSFLEAELPRAEAILREVFALQRRRLERAEETKSDQVAKEALECVCTLAALCNVHVRRGEPLKAVPRAVEMQQLVAKVANQEFAAFINNFFSYQQWKTLGQHSLAERSLRQALAALEKRVGQQHFLHTLLRRDLGTFLHDIGRHEDAEKVFLDLEESYRQNFVGDATGLAVFYGLLAQAIEHGALAKARHAEDQAIRKEAARVRHYFRAAFDTGKKCDIDWYLISVYGIHLARTHLDLSPEPDLAEAEQVARECWHLRRRYFVPGHELNEHPFRYLIASLERQNKSAAIDEAYLELLTATPAPTWAAIWSKQLTHGAALLARAGRTKSALLVLEQAARAGASLDDIRNDAAFESLHKLDGYQKLLRK